MSFCLEKKILLSGEVRTFSCELVHFEKGFGILKYVIDAEYDIKGIQLRPGDVTCALYWEDRPYTLYIWHRDSDKDAIHYFNIADRITLSPGEFSWRDLSVDILIDAAGRPHVLDEDELPAGLGPELTGYIQRAKDYLLIHFRDEIREANELIGTDCL